MVPNHLDDIAELLRPPRPKRICMVSYSFYSSDARVVRYATSLAGRGDQVDVVALKGSREEASVEQFGNIRLIRIQPRLHKNQKSRLAFLAPIIRFFFSSLAWVARQHARQPYDLLHIHNVPDFLVFTALYPALRGAKVILDIHDILPEFYSAKFGASPRSLLARLLRLVERVSAAFADHVIIANDLWREAYAARTNSTHKCSVFINNVDPAVFYPRPRVRGDDKLIVMFPGGLQWHQGLDLAIRAFAKVRAELPQSEFHIYGEGNEKDRLMSLACELGLDGAVRFFKSVPLDQIVQLMANADLGVVPKRADSFGNQAYSTKIMEFMSLGIPVVVSKTKIDSFYFNDSVVRFFESGNVEALAKAMIEVLRDPVLRQALRTNGLEYAARNNWRARRLAYLDLVDTLVADQPGRKFGGELRASGANGGEATRETVCAK